MEVILGWIIAIVFVLLIIGGVYEIEKWSKTRSQNKVPSEGKLLSEEETKKLLKDIGIDGNDKK